jgi:AP-3 complex subunit beta
MMYRSQPCLPFFSSVVKNVASPNFEIKKLVYIYLLNHAETEPDLALLSINTIQKSLSDGNPQVRALALKTMSGIRVPVISQIVSLAIKKGLGDMSPYVRKAAALAIPKCYRLDPNTLPQLLDYLATLLGDKQYYVAGAAVSAFLEICPERLDLIHKHYRGLVKKIVDMDEWSQLATLRLMTDYSRRCFPRRTKKVTKSSGTKGFYGDEDGDDQEETTEVVSVMDPDLELLLKSIKPLLQSRNAGVVVAVTRCYVNLGTPEYLTLAIGPLVALLRGPQDIQHVALYNIVSVCLERPQEFVKYASHFLLHTTDPAQVWELKLELLTLIFPHCEPHIKSLILNELEHFSGSADKALVRESVRAIGRCAQSDTKTSARCLRLLLKQITSPDGNLVAESLTVIRHLIQQDPESHTNTVIRLAKNLDTATNPRARATIIWLVGEFSGIDGENNIAPDVLRILAKGFVDEAEPAKLQIVLLAAKVYLHYLNRTGAGEVAFKPASNPEISHQDLLSDAEDRGFREHNSTLNDPSFASQPSPEHPIVLLWNYILLLARYDVSYDIRDRTRLYKALLAVPSSTQLASLMLLAPKPVPHTPSPSESRKGFTLGSASLVVGDDGGMHGLRGYEPLPEWVKAGREPDPSLRDVDVASGGYDDKRVVAAGEILDNAVQKGKSVQQHDLIRSNGSGSGSGSGSGTPAKEKTLDDWLAESEEEEESEDGDDNDEDEEEEESDEDEESTEEASDAEDDESDDDNEHDRLVK